MPKPCTRRDLFAAAAAVLLAAGCSETVSSAPGERPRGSIPGFQLPAEAGQTRPDLRSVAMVGDSITVRSKPALTTVFNAQGITSVVIDAEVSRRIEIGNGKQEPLNGEQVMTNLLKIGVDPDVWVVALGTNDVGSYDQAGYAALIDAMLAKLPASKPLVWIDVFRPSDMSDTVLFNQVLRDRAARRPHTLVASWFDVASKSPKKLLTSDNLHPSDAGTLAFADVVGSAVALAR